MCILFLDQNFLTMFDSMNLVQSVSVNKLATVNTYNVFSYFSYLKTSSGDVNYYVNDDSGISIYNSNWTFTNLLNSTFPTDGYMVIVNDNIYIAGMANQWFLRLNSSNLDVIKNNTLVNGSYSNGICWDSVNNRLLALVQTTSTNEIWIYDLNLNLNQTSIINLPLKPQNDYASAIYYFKNQYYIGTGHGIVYLINSNNTTSYSNFNVCPSRFSVNSIQVDIYSNILITCNLLPYLYLYQPNGTLFKTFNSIANAQLTFAGVDQTGRVMAVAMNLNKIFMFF